MAFLRGISWALGHVYERKVRQPMRARAWKSRRTAFEHRTVRNLVFKLRPNEYIDRFIFIEGIYERRFLDVVRAYFEAVPATVALDIGSNIGNHALYLSDCFEEIHCFDPNPVAIERLRENVRLSNLSSIAIHPIGLSNRKAELWFLVDHADLGSSHFVDSPEEGTIKLPVAMGDDYVDNLGLKSIDFIKIDVENHEPEVFEGLRRTLHRFRPIVAFEHHGGKVPQSHFDRIAAVLPNYMFRELQYLTADASITGKLWWHVRRAGRPLLVAFEQPELRTYENILAFPDVRTLLQFEARAGA